MSKSLDRVMFLFLTFAKKGIFLFLGFQKHWPINVEDFKKFNTITTNTNRIRFVKRKRDHGSAIRNVKNISLGDLPEEEFADI